jgi:hypothetical protein
VLLVRHYGQSATKTVTQDIDGPFSVRTKSRWMACVGIDRLRNASYKIDQYRCQVISGNVPLIDWPPHNPISIRAIYPEEIVVSEKPFVEITGGWRCSTPRCLDERAMTSNLSDTVSKTRAAKVCTTFGFGAPLDWTKPDYDGGIASMEVTCLISAG